MMTNASTPAPRSQVNELNLFTGTAGVPPAIVLYHDESNVTAFLRYAGCGRDARDPSHIA